MGLEKAKSNVSLGPAAKKQRRTLGRELPGHGCGEQPSTGRYSALSFPGSLVLLLACRLVTRRVIAERNDNQGVRSTFPHNEDPPTRIPVGADIDVR